METANLKAEVTTDWADGTYTFRLTVSRAIELEQKCGAPFGTVLRRLESGRDFYVNDVRETVRLGLIGGGTKPDDAVRLVRLYVDERPLAENMPLARLILLGIMFGFEAAPLTGNREAAAIPKRSTPRKSTKRQPLPA